jgi:hypothetical protein
MTSDAGWDECTHLVPITDRRAGRCQGVTHSHPGGPIVVNPLKRRLRSLLIALAVLALSAGVALAGRASHPTTVGQPEPAAGQGDASEQGEAAEGADGEQGDDADKSDAETPETEPPETDEADPGAAADAATGEHPDNHGKLVSEAAHADTPAGFDNHGEYVRTVAKANHGHDTSTDANTKGKKNPKP